MRAFATVLLAAALLVPLALFASSQADAAAMAGAEIARFRAAEANYYAGEEALNGMFAVMREAAREKMNGGLERGNAPSSGVRESIVEIGLRMQELEKMAEDRKDGVVVDFWCGRASEEEVGALAKQMAREKRALKCGNCFDASESVALAGEEGLESVPACAFFASVALDEFVPGSGKAGVGNSALLLMLDRNGRPRVPLDARAAEIAAGVGEGRAAYGVSVYDGRTGAASVSVAWEGEMRGY